jgi:hypothetical protein
VERGSIRRNESKAPMLPKDQLQDSDTEAEIREEVENHYGTAAYGQQGSEEGDFDQEDEEDEGEGQYECNKSNPFLIKLERNRED